jgi:hypothetical protein
LVLVFLTGLLQRLLKLLDFLHWLGEVLVSGITLISAFLSGAETGFLLSVLLKPTTITSVVRGMCAPMLLAWFAVLLKVDFLGNPDPRVGTRAFLPFLALIGRLVGFLNII